MCDLEKTGSITIQGATNTIHAEDKSLIRMKRPCPVNDGLLNRSVQFNDNFITTSKKSMAAEPRHRGDDVKQYHQWHRLVSTLTTHTETKGQVLQARSSSRPVI